MIRKFFNEYKKLIALAAPLIFIQLCQASLGLVDTLLAGRYHYVDLAAVGLGSAIWSSIYIFLVGILYVLVPKFAQLSAKNTIEKRQKLYRVAKKLVIQLSIIGIILVNVAAFLAEYFIEDKVVGQMTKLYMQCVSLGFPALTALSMLRFVCEGHKLLRVIMQVSISLLVLNFILSYWMVYGGFFVPSLGGLGCAVGTVLSAYLSLYLLFKLTQKQLPEIINGNMGEQKGLFAQASLLLKEGLPIGVGLVLQIFALALIAFTAASLGTKYVAAHQIMINIAMCIVMIPLALGNASTIQISGDIAHDNTLSIKNTIISSAISFVIYSVAVFFVLMVGHKTIISSFTVDQEVMQIANSVLIYFIGFLIFDSVQMILAGILRGFQDFVRPLIATFVAYWLFSLPILFVLNRAWVYELSSLSTIWLVIMLGLFIASLFLAYSTYLSVKAIKKFK